MLSRVNIVNCVNSQSPVVRRAGMGPQCQRRGETNAELEKLALPIHLFLVPISFMSNTYVEKYFCVVAMKALAVVADDTADS